MKPEFWTDRKTARLSRDARLLYIALWNQADEWGRLHGDARYIKGHCLPYDDDLSLDDIDSLLDELEQFGRVVKYVVDDDPYLYVPKLGAHQRLEPAKVPSRLPEPPADGQTSPDTPSSAPRADVPARNANTSGAIVAKHVAGGREQVAGISSTSPDGDEAPGDFTEFWRQYPRKVRKQSAIKAYRKARRKTPADVILAGVIRYAAEREGADARFTAHPASWLNAGGWDDEPTNVVRLSPDGFTLPPTGTDPHDEWGFD